MDEPESGSSSRILIALGLRKRLLPRGHPKAMGVVVVVHDEKLGLAIVPFDDLGSGVPQS